MNEIVRSVRRISPHQWLWVGAGALVTGAVVWGATRKGKAVLTLADLVELARKHGFPNPALAAAVAMAESGGNVAILGDRTLGGSYGLWQIHHPSHPEFSLGKLTTADGNASAAFAISRGGSNWAPWTTFRTGAYKRYLTS